MHDASEAYIQDLPSPLKTLLPQYKVLESRVEKAIAKKFNLTLPHPVEVKNIDMVMLVTEMRDFMKGNDRKRLTSKPLTEKLYSWSQEEAHREFMFRYDKLKKNNRSYIRPPV